VTGTKQGAAGDGAPLLKGTAERLSVSTNEIAKQARRRTARIVRGSTNELAIYTGHDCCGFIRPSGDGFLLLSADRRTVGIFISLHEALQAIGWAR
jgi:hypothetical protein